MNVRRRWRPVRRNASCVLRPPSLFLSLSLTRHVTIFSYLYMMYACVYALPGSACACVRERARLCGGDGGGGGWKITTSSPSCLGQGCAALTLLPPPPRIVYDNRRAAFPTLRKKENTLRVRNTQRKYVLRTMNASFMNHVMFFFFHTRTPRFTRRYYCWLYTHTHTFCIIQRYRA